MNRLACALLAAAAFAVQPAQAQNWPERSIRLVVPFPAGSSTDVVGRLLMQKLSEKLGQQIVVENKAGASGSLGADQTAKADPDGYTMGMITGSTHALAPALGNKLPYDPIKDFKPVSMIGAAPYVLVLYPGIEAKSVQEFVALAKKNPGKFNYGSAGLASLAHLAGAMFESQTDTKLTHIPYKSSAQSVVDIISGRLDMQFAAIAPVLSNIQAGQIRALATTGRKRTSALPNLPTMVEAGVPNYEVALWMAFVMPAATPDAIVARVNKEMTALLNDKDIQTQMRSRGIEPEPGPPGDVTKRITTEIATFSALAAKAGIKTK